MTAHGPRADLDESQIRAALTGRFGKELRFFEEIGSTNSEAMDWAASGGPEGALVVAGHQTGGRGRWGRSWFSAPGKLLQFSLILRPNLEPTKHGLITAGLGVATARALRALTDLPVEIKWPNDAVVQGRKLAGMLVESTMTGSTIDAAICGIGINVHLQPDDIPDDLKERATSIAIEMAARGTGSPPPLADLLAAVVGEIEESYRSVTGSSDALLDEAAELSAVLGKQVVVRAADGSKVEGLVEGFDPDGALRVIVDGRPSSLHVGEIEQLRIS